MIGENCISKFFVIFVLFLVVALSGYSDAMPAAGTVEVYFSPNGGATDAVVHEIDTAKTEILLQAYSFTSKPIAKALLAAHKRGVKVIAVLDKSQRTERYSGATFLANADIPVFIDDRHAIAHNKVMVLDRSTLITGSFNFTKAAEEKNAENLLVMKANPALVERYLTNFEEHRGHSEAYSGRQ